MVQSIDGDRKSQQSLPVIEEKPVPEREGAQSALPRMREQEEPSDFRKPVVEVELLSSGPNTDLDKSQAIEVTLEKPPTPKMRIIEPISPPLEVAEDGCGRPAVVSTH